MKSVLISIQPQSCELIVSRKKTIEVRKSAPKEVPFKAYIYQTKKRWIYKLLPWLEERQGKVIGEFICDKVEKFTVGSLKSDDIEKLAFLTYEELIKYFYKPCELDGNTVKFGYALHIRDLKIYVNPKKLGEFYKYDKTYDNSFGWAFEDRTKNIPITRPPQSWCYVEEIEE